MASRGYEEISEGPFGRAGNGSKGSETKRVSSHSHHGHHKSSGAQYVNVMIVIAGWLLVCTLIVPLISSELLLQVLAYSLSPRAGPLCALRTEAAWRQAVTAAARRTKVQLFSEPSQACSVNYLCEKAFNIRRAASPHHDGQLSCAWTVSTRKRTCVG